jgi:uncharacterized membrane protein
MRWTLLAMMAASYAVVLASMRGREVRIDMIATIMLGIFFMALARVIELIEPNSVIGIRTPWTLRSRRVWEATHRAGGRVFLLLGLVTVAMGILRVPGSLVLAILALLLGSAALVLHSHRAWRHDPQDRIEANQ